jgi:hypothetical protein
MDIAQNRHRLPATDDRVPRNTSRRANAEIRESTLKNLQRFVGAPPRRIDTRIDELRREWDIERTLETNASLVALTGLALGVTVDKRFLLVPAVVAGFLFQHAVQGWCPPLPVLRRMGVRTSAEIHEEILALRTLRGDFGDDVDKAEDALLQAMNP